MAKRVRHGQTWAVAAYLPMATALAILLTAGLFAERLSRDLARGDLRAEVQASLVTIRDDLRAAIEVQTHALDHAVGALSADPAMDAVRFARLAPVLTPDRGIRPTLVVRRTDGTVLQAPPAGGRPPVDLPAATRPGSAIVPGEGGPDLMVWMAIPAVAPGEGTAVGPTAGASVPVAALLAAAGLTDDRQDLALVLTAPGLGWTAPLMGDPASLPSDALTMRVGLPSGALLIAAAPRGGWAAAPAAVWPIRVLTLVSMALVVGPMLRTLHLIGERQRNIGALREREAQLDRLSRRLGLALDASRVGVWDFNITKDELVWDARMNELYAVQRHDRGPGYGDWRDRLHPEDLSRAEAEFRAAIEQTGRYNSEFRLVLPDGLVRHIRAIGAVYRDADGTSKIVGVNWDVTADVRRNAELEAKRVEAEAASVAKSQFLATMSHEIRTPMNGVIGMLDLVLRSDLAPEQRARAQIAGDSARHLLSILNDILDFSKLEAKQVDLELADADVAGIARDVIALLSAGAEERAISIGATIDPGLPAWLVCDASRLRQVLINLVGNAVKFTEDGSIDLRLGYRHGRLSIAVCDTGVGIPEADRSKLFQRFAQVDSSVTRRRGGTGLGLAICKQLVEVMGGEIDLQSMPGLGSTFHFEIPAAPGNPPTGGVQDDGAWPAIPAEPERTMPRRILLAEDNATNQQILSAYLALGGHAVRIVPNGRDALAQVQTGHFDLVLMDIQMPVMDGLSAARAIRALAGPTRHIPIVALTANAMRGDREIYLASGMTDYVSKPVSVDALHAAIARACASVAETSGQSATLRTAAAHRGS